MVATYHFLCRNNRIIPILSRNGRIISFLGRNGRNISFFARNCHNIPHLVRNKPILSRNGRTISFLVRNGRSIPILSRNGCNISFFVSHRQLESSRSKHIEPGSRRSKHTNFGRLGRKKILVDSVETFFSRPKSRNFFGRAKSQHNHFELQWSQHTFFGSRKVATYICFGSR